MNKRLIVLLSLFFAAAAWFLWQRRELIGLEPDRRSASASPTAQRSTSRSKEVGAAPGKQGKSGPTQATDSVPRLDVDDTVKAFLIATDDKTSIAVTAAYELTKSEVYSAIASARWWIDPNNVGCPQMAVISMIPIAEQKQGIVWKGQEARIAQWAERDPDNGAPHVVLAACALYQGDTQKMLDRLSEAVARDRMDIYTWERREEARKLIHAAGITEEQKRKFKLKSVDGIAFEKHYVPVLQELEKLQAAAEAAGDTARSDELASLGAGLALRLRQLPTLSGVDEIWALGTENRMLGKLPPDTLYGHTGKTVAQKLAENKQSSAELLRLLSLPRDWHSQATPEQMAIFKERLDRYGDRAAISWLEAELKR